MMEHNNQFDSDAENVSALQSETEISVDDQKQSVSEFKYRKHSLRRCWASKAKARPRMFFRFPFRLFF
ncbi:hypothetical protein VNO78_28451 [Psophocarpus tetragonolobus]|uniref:Uncharacterized protein n=1 Tax=Psophocarpus tetragonolobus TaxID=3891 RepID=A0AAN9S275_PSOTE